MSLVLQNVSKRVGTEEHIRDVSLTLEKGSLNVLLGPTLAGLALIVFELYTAGVGVAGVREEPLVHVVADDGPLVEHGAAALIHARELLSEPFQ